MSEEENIYQIIAKEFAGEISDLERFQLEEWKKKSPLNQRVYLTLKRAWNESSVITNRTREEKLFQKIITGIKEEGPGEKQRPLYLKSKSRKNFFWKYAMAAMVAIIIASAWLIQRMQIDNSHKDETPEVAYIEKTNPNGQKSNIHLSDGTAIQMNAGSRIKFPAVFANDKRVIELEGEAFFTVVSDPERPFTVLSGTLSTTALGTAFNIKAFPDEERMKISLAEGKVVVNRIDRPDQKSYFLNPGESIEYNKQNQNIRKIGFSPESEFAWKEGVITFKKASFEEIIYKLERWYGVKFVVRRQKVIKKGFTGSFKKKSLDEVLKGISFSSDFEYEIKDKTVIIR